MKWSLLIFTLSAAVSASAQQATPRRPANLQPQTLDTQAVTYSYDGSGNIKAIGTDTFVYDTLGRLTSATVSGNTQTYTYDAFGNRTAATRAAGAAGCVGQTNCEATLTVTKSTNHVVEAGYDDAGNTQTGFGATYTYDGAGMVTHAVVALGGGATDDRVFLYTADDERLAVRQGVSWTWTVRDQANNVLRELTSLENSPYVLTNHLWSKDYIWRDRLLLATNAPTSPGSSTTLTSHYHLDHLGTPRLVTQSGGTVAGRHTYYPFGAEMETNNQQEAPLTAMKFTGHERDQIVGDNHTTDYMHARLYNANLGRFSGVDPTVDIEKNSPEPQRWNRYAYVSNNPLGYTDANGRERLQAYHFHRQPVPWQGWKKEIVTTAQHAAFIGTLMFGPEIITTALAAFLANPVGVTNAIGNALTPGPGEGLSPGAVGTKIGSRVAGQASGKMRAVASEISAMGMSQAHAATAVDSAVQAMGLRTTGVLRAGENLVVGSVQLGTNRPVLMIDAEGVVHQATATLETVRNSLDIVVKDIKY